MIRALEKTPRTRTTGVIALVVIALILVLSFRMSTLSALVHRGGLTLHAEFTDVSGIAPGTVVRIAGIEVGSVRAIRVKRDHAVADLQVSTSVRLGTGTTAALQLDTLLGQHSVGLTPSGAGQLASGATIDLAHTTTPFGVTDALLNVGSELAPIDTAALTSALSTIASVADPAAPQVRTAATGLSALSATVASRESDVRELFRQTAAISRTLSTRSADLATLLSNSSAILTALSEREQVIRSLLKTTGDLAATITGVIRDNEKTLTPALEHLHAVLDVLRTNQANLDESLRLLAPYLRYFTNVIGNGRWFDGTFAGLLPVDVRGPLPVSP